MPSDGHFPASRLMYLMAALMAALLVLAAAPAMAHECPPAPQCQAGECPRKDDCAHTHTAAPSSPTAQPTPDGPVPGNSFLSGLTQSAGAMEIYVPLAALGLAGGQLGMLAIGAATALALGGFYFGMAAIQLGLVVDAFLIGPACLLIAGLLLVIPKGYLRLPLFIMALPVGMACGLLFELYFAPFDLPLASAFGMTVVPSAALVLGAGLSLSMNKPWFVIALRILGSWLIAGALMLFALTL
ncbi:MAG: hypothetical protein ACE5FM_00665 [Methyloligellaceae bacterium]